MGTAEEGGGARRLSHTPSMRQRGSVANTKLFAGVKTVGRLDVVTDDRGHEVIVEAREDSEQTQRYKEIIDLLVAAGYFRARIQGLSPFDQVVGGIVWCITICNFNVDVDILFQENANVGEKISLVEKIVSVLPRMKCPHAIQPHEIQGFNYIAIYPIIQWLVKQVIIHREAMGDQNKAQSVFNFCKRHELPKTTQLQLSSVAAKNNAVALRKENLPSRCFKRSSNKKLKSEQALIQCTLLEFGKKGDILQLLSEGSTDTSQDDAANVVDQMLGSMTSSASGGSSSGGAMKLSSAVVGSLLSEKVDQVTQLQAQFDVKKSEAENSPAQQHAKQVAQLQSRISETEKMIIEKAKTYQQMNEAYKVKKAELIDLQQKTETIDNLLDELKQLETDENKAALETLKSLVKQHETVKQKESAFKAKCKEDAELVAKQVEELKQQLADATSGNQTSVPAEILEAHEDLKSRVAKAEALIGRKMREMAGYQRLLDDIPSKAELIQYQKRFVELYNQMSFKYTETKHQYALYNTLSDTKSYMEKEISLLNSIHDGYEAAIKASTESKKNFLSHMESVTESTGLAKDKVLMGQSGAKKTRDELNGQLMDLLDKQRQYFHTVKELQEEFNRKM